MLSCKQIRANKELSYQFGMDVPTEKNTKTRISCMNMKAEKGKEHKIYLTWCEPP